MIGTAALSALETVQSPGESKKEDFMQWWGHFIGTGTAVVALSAAFGGVERGIRGPNPKFAARATLQQDEVDAAAVENEAGEDSWSLRKTVDAIRKRASNRINAVEHLKVTGWTYWSVKPIRLLKAKRELEIGAGIDNILSGGRLTRSEANGDPGSPRPTSAPSHANPVGIPLHAPPVKDTGVRLGAAPATPMGPARTTSDTVGSIPGSLGSQRGTSSPRTPPRSYDTPR